MEKFRCIWVGSYYISKKLKGLKAFFRRWNNEVFGKVDVKNEALEKLASWDTLAAQRILSSDEIDSKTKELESFKKWAFVEELMLRQKSREIWLEVRKIRHFSIKWKTPTEEPMKFFK